MAGYPVFKANRGDTHSSRRALTDYTQTAMGPPADQCRLPGTHVHCKWPACPVPQSIRVQWVSERQVDAVLGPGAGDISDSGEYIQVYSWLVH